MSRLITQKNQPPRPKGGLLALLIILVFMSIALIAMFIARMGNPTAAKAAERPEMAVSAVQHLPYLLYNYGMQEALLPSTAELTPTTALTDGVSLKPGMTMDVNFPPQISSKVGDIGAFSADFYLGVITNRAVDYGVIGYTVAGRRLWLQLRNPELGSWSMGFAAAEFFDRIIVKPSLPAEVSLDLVKTEGTAVNVRSAAGAAAPIIGKIINPLIRYEAQGGVQLGDQYWHKIVNPHYVAGDPRDGWRDGYVLAVCFIVH